MKTFRTLTAVLALASLPALTLAQESEVKVVSGPITTGSIASVDRNNHSMVVNSAETGKQLTFVGMEKVRVETANGQLLTFAFVQPKMPVTVHYANLDGRLVAARLVVPTPTPIAPVPATAGDLTGAEAKALRSKAANDGDITTEPGVKARIDDDITTQPGKKDPLNPDITKKADN